ncbi:MAG: dihydropteroate synthase [Balneolales bacterium]
MVYNQQSGSDYDSSKRFVLTGKALSVSTPCIMGILNVTPDSFSDGGQVRSTDEALLRIESMVHEGAGIIDIGGESTRPGSDPVSVEEELNRVIPAINKAIDLFPEILFSVDTTKYEVARKALDCGVHVVNDVSGLELEPRLAGLCAEYRAALVIMHSQGPPETMQDSPKYRNVVTEITEFLNKKATFAKEKGVQQIIIDPGIGFGKTLQHNLEIFAQLDVFSRIGYPVMVGASRKSMIGQILADESGPRSVKKRLAGTLALHYHALMHGADILRVHDVRDTRDTLEIFKAIAKMIR